MVLFIKALYPSTCVCLDITNEICKAYCDGEGGEDMYMIGHSPYGICIATHCSNNPTHITENAWQMFWLHQASCALGVKNNMQADVD